LPYTGATAVAVGSAGASARTGRDGDDIGFVTSIGECRRGRRACGEVCALTGGCCGEWTGVSGVVGSLGYWLWGIHYRYIFMSTCDCTSKKYADGYVAIGDSSPPTSLLPERTNDSEWSTKNSRQSLGTQMPSHARFAWRLGTRAVAGYGAGIACTCTYLTRPTVP